MSAPYSYQLSDYLERLPATTFKKLYQQPSTAFAIHRRMLPPLAKVFVQALLYAPEPLLLSQLDLMVREEGKLLRDRALSVLRSLHIVQITAPSRDRPQEIQLATNFKNSMRLVLEGGGNHNSFGVPSTLPVDPQIDIAYLDRYARKKWEGILQYVVNTVTVPPPERGENKVAAQPSVQPSGAAPQAGVKNLLLAGRLVERKKDGKISITRTGFSFLLQEANAQVWTLLLLWLEAAEHDKSSGMDSIDMLTFLFMLGTLELGTAYDTTALTELRRNMLPTLADFGLIYIPRPRDSASEMPRQYFPTRLATTLTSSTSALRSVSSGFNAAVGAPRGGNAADSSLGTDPTAALAAQEPKGIIIETNHRLYAYTSSPLQIAVLCLFMRPNMRFPNMVSGRLTRESIRRAIGFGITADQIISYLTAHAHEQMHQQAARNNTSILPSTVMDQIRLWQLENERMRTDAGFLFKEFETKQDYFLVANYAEECGVLVWRNDEKAMFFARKTEQIRDFIKTKKKEGS